MKLLSWASWIRTSECSSQSAVPYRLAIAHYLQPSRSDLRWIKDSNPWPPEPQSGALTNCAIPTMSKFLWVSGETPDNVLEGIRTPTHGLEGRCSIQLSYEHTTVMRTFITKRVMGIEPTYPAWKAGVLPLNYTRI